MTTIDKLIFAGSYLSDKCEGINSHELSRKLITFFDHEPSAISVEIPVVIRHGEINGYTFGGAGIATVWRSGNVQIEHVSN